MKTILYQPLFINPQAYFVFPQLYHKDNSIVYQTKNKYNEQTIYPGDKQDTDTLFIGTIRKDDLRSFIGCHGDIFLFNRTLTEYEISWVKNNMMCSKQQEPDIDL